MEILSIKDLTFSYPNKENFALQNVNLSINSGDFVVVCGQSGSGKTTLLSIIAGFKHYTEGKVKIFGQEMNNDNILEIRRKIQRLEKEMYK